MTSNDYLTASGDCTVTTNAEAHASKLVAKRIRLNVSDNPGLNPYLSGLDMEIADKLETSADAYLTLAEIPEQGAGGEFVPVERGNLPYIAGTMKMPDRVTVDASLDRVELAHQSGVLNMALDTAEAIGARNGAEQMLAHQMAAAHRTSLEFLMEAGNTRDTIEKCRLANTAAKLMDTYQKAMLTFNRLRNGGQQTVTVQHVQVSDGGQAVINGSVDARGRGSAEK